MTPPSREKKIVQNNFDPTKLDALSYQKLSFKEKQSTLKQIMQICEGSNLLTSSQTKHFFTLLASTNSENNFNDRKKAYESEFRSHLNSKSLSMKLPYWNKARIKSKTEPYNKWLYDPFQGYRTQNTALIHFLADKSLRQAPDTRVRTNSAPEKFYEAEGYMPLDQRSFLKEEIAQRLRNRVFADVETANYTFVPEKGTELYKVATLFRLFPNMNQLTLTLASNHSKARPKGSVNKRGQRGQQLCSC
jgi:hypothetical protein